MKCILIFPDREQSFDTTSEMRRYCRGKYLFYYRGQRIVPNGKVSMYEKNTVSKYILFSTEENN